MLVVRGAGVPIHEGLAEIVDDEPTPGLQVVRIGVQSLFQVLGLFAGELHSNADVILKLARGSRSNSDAEREQHNDRDPQPAVHGLPP